MPENNLRRGVIVGKIEQEKNWKNKEENNNCEGS